MTNKQACRGESWTPSQLSLRWKVEKRKILASPSLQVQLWARHSSISNRTISEEEKDPNVDTVSHYVEREGQELRKRQGRK